MQTELGQIIIQFRKSWLGIGLLSATSSVLALTGSVFMLSVYDQVIPSGSIPTLLALGLLCLAAYGLQALVEITRGMMLTRIGLATKEALSPRVYNIAVREAAAGRGTSTASRDLDQIQSFLSSAGPTALFDIPWVPLYLAICFAFHFWIGVFASGAVLLLVGLAVANELLARGPSRELAEATAGRMQLLSASHQQAETLEALGMTANVASRWHASTDSAVTLGAKLADATGIAGAISRIARMIVQSAVLALGAYLVMSGEATGGIMIAGSILSSRALAPIEAAIANAKGFLAARQSWTRLNTALRDAPEETAAFVPPKPSKRLSTDNLSITLGNRTEHTLAQVAFSVEAGHCLAILGAGGAGKSTLLRAIVGLLRPASGSIRLDGAQVSHWPSAERGRFVGYLPQQVALFEGTIAQNIGRFDPGATSETVIEAARAAGVHEMVSRLPDGYMTRLGPGGIGLSGGQTQRIGLARALYGHPFLVVLDEPSSNADAEGDAALLRAVAQLRRRGAIVVVATHGHALLAAATHALVLANGRQQRFGPLEEVLKRAPANAIPKVHHAA